MKKKSDLLLISCIFCVTAFLLGMIVSCDQSTAGVVYLQSPLSWEIGHSERSAWSVELRKQIELNLNLFSLASDWDSYCLGFKNLTKDQKVGAIAALAVGIAKYESNYNPKSIAPHDANGTASIGLFQLSYEDNMKWCAMNKAKGNLIDPIVNIQCAVPKMAKLIAEDGVVAVGEKKGTRKSLARYWSTTWPSSHLPDIKYAVKSLQFCKNSSDNR